METPVRVQLRRTKGWRMPENTVKVDRSTKWGNPFVAGRNHPMIHGRGVEDRRHAWRLYQGYAPVNETLVALARQLAGKNLACWCPLPTESYEPDMCHAAVLLEIANAPERAGPS